MPHRRAVARERGSLLLCVYNLATSALYLAPKVLTTLTRPTALTTLPTHTTHYLAPKALTMRISSTRTKLPTLTTTLTTHHLAPKVAFGVFGDTAETWLLGDAVSILLPSCCTCPTYCSLLTTYDSSLTTHYSLLTTQVSIPLAWLLYVPFLAHVLQRDSAFWLR